MRPSFRSLYMGLLAGSAALIGCRYVRNRWRTFLAYAQACSKCGYLPDPPSERGRALTRQLSRFLVWLQVGRIEISGAANLDSHAPRIIMANHPHSVDPFVFGLLLREPARYMTAAGVMKFCGGLGAMILAPCGAFSVDLRRGKGIPAMKSAVQVLTSGQTLVIFPEGWAHLDGVTRPFKRGVVYIARMAAEQIGRPIPIVPVHLTHGVHPGRWINRLNPRLQFVLMPLAFAFYRRGARVTVGSPILSSALPSDDIAAANYLQTQVLSLAPSGNNGATSRSTVDASCSDPATSKRRDELVSSH